MNVYNILLNFAKRNPYPVGSIYMSINNTNPSTLFGGTWEQIKDTFLLSAGNTYTAGSTGGAATHTPTGNVDSHQLTLTEIPSHSHGVGSRNPNSVIGQPYSSGDGVAREFLGNYTYSSYSTNSQGGNGGHTHGVSGVSVDTMPPYLAVYVWKRTA